MRYSRVLTGLALVGVVALAATLLIRTAPTPVRAATTYQHLEKALHGVLGQALQGLAIARARTRGVPPLAVQPQGQTCLVDQCSLKPCVEFVQGGGPVPLPSSGPAVLTAPRLGVPRTGSACARHGNPRSMWVKAQTVVATPVAAPVVRAAPAPSGSKHTGP